jgi:hypothetical protein
MSFNICRGALGSLAMFTDARLRRRLPILLLGRPAAATFVYIDLFSQSRGWCLIPSAGVQKKSPANGAFSRGHLRLGG